MYIHPLAQYIVVCLNHDSHVRICDTPLSTAWAEFPALARHILTPRTAGRGSVAANRNSIEEK